MTRRSVALFALFAFVSLSGFFAGWLFREGLDARALAALGLTVLVALAAGAIASLPQTAR